MCGIVKVKRKENAMTSYKSFDYFCMEHCCREGMEHRSDFCPIMCEHKNILKTIPRDCQLIYGSKYKDINKNLKSYLEI